MRGSNLPYVVLGIGVLIVSTSAILSRGLIGLGVPTLAIAAGRLAFASLILTPLAWAKAGPQIRRLERRDWLWGLAAGAMLAVHFASWISSLAFTSVASSTALVATNPLFVALASWLIFRERLARGTWLGVALTVAGSALIGFSDSGGGSGANPLLGDGLALLGALTASGYFLAGRSLRSRVDLLPYIWMVYGVAALLLLALLPLAGLALTGLPPLAYALLLGLAVGPQLLGHTSFNWAIKYLSPTVVTVAILGEPIGSALLALLFFQEPLQPLQLAGGAVLLAGIAGATLAERGAPAVQPAESAP
ncbi:MAG TPA: DMT family transporter [Herpetosiphonaceae bacterium]